MEAKRIQEKTSSCVDSCTTIEPMAGDVRGTNADNLKLSISQSQRALTFLADAFCAGVPLRQALDTTQAKYGNVVWATVEMQRALFGATLEYGDTLATQILGFSFGAARCMRFLRLLLDEIDHCGAPIDEKLVMRAAESCTSTSRSSEQLNGVGLNSNGREKLRWIALRVPPEKDQNRVLLRVADAFSQLAMCVWDAGVYMYAHIVNSRSPVHASVVKARVLELGAGTGICARAFKQAGASHVLMTDLPKALDNLQTNIVVNGASDVVSIQSLDFTQTQDVVRVVREGNFRTVVAADVAYDEILVRAIVSTLTAVLEDSIADISYLFTTKRNPRSLELLTSLLQSSPLDVTSVKVIDDIGNGSFEYLIQWNWSSIYVLCLRLKR